MIRSMQEGFLFGLKFVGSEINCDRPSRDKRFSISLPSMVVSPSGHQICEWPLKSPVKKVANGFSFLILEYRLLKSNRKFVNSGDVWLKAGLLYSTVKKIFLRPKFSSTTIDSLNERSFLILMGSEFWLKSPTPPCLVFAGLLDDTKV